MKTPNSFKNLKAGIFATCLLSFTIAAAQQTTGDVTKQGDVDPGTTTTAGAVRVVDNKGTIKYLQSQNGITMLSNTTDDVTTTTWQLGGTLTDNTFIDVDGNVFGLDGIALVDTATESASTDAETATSADGTDSGYTFLVRDEETGATKKLLASDIDIITSGQQSFTTTTAQAATPDYVLTGSPTLPGFSQVWVYRNGSKLIAGSDYTVSGSTVSLQPGGTAPNDWDVYEGDVIEVQYIR